MTDWTKLAGDLERLLKLRSHVFGMKLFESRSEMEAIPRIRRPKSVHTLDQVVGQVVASHRVLSTERNARLILTHGCHRRTEAGGPALRSTPSEACSGRG